MHRSMQKHLQGRRRQHCTEAHESTLNEMTTLYRGTRKHFERNDNTAQRHAKALKRDNTAQRHFERGDNTAQRHAKAL